MSFDKKKAMRSAERFLTQGKIRSAIDEYKKVVENNPKDYSTLNILGDLYAKNSDEKEAVKCFMQVAEHYNQQGFSNKAIAIYNKISKIIPDSLEVSAKLAQLYQQRGSNAEARLHYQRLAESYEKTGQKIEAIAIWNKIAELDPRDTDVYLKIAENCRNENQLDDAAEAYSKAGLRFSELKEYESAVSAFQKVFEIKDLDIKALDGYVKAQIGLGCADEAVNLLKTAMEREPYNRDLQYLLVDCYLDLNQPLEAEELTVRLVEQEPGKYYKLVELVEIYSKGNDLDSAIRVLSKATEYLLTGGQAVDFLKWTNEILARNPESIEALQMLVRYHTWQRDETEVKNSLERLAETAQITENYQVESETLARLLMMYPQDADYSERLQELKLKYDVGDEVVLGHHITNEAPKFENFSGLSESNETIQIQPENIEQIREFEGEVKEDVEIGFQTFRDIKLDEPTVQNEQIETFSQSDENTAENGFQMMSPEGLEINGEESEVSQAEEYVHVEENDLSGNGVEVHTEKTHSEKSLPDSNAKLSLVDELRLHKDIESIEFYIEQDYIDIAEKSLAALEAEFGNREEFAHLREKLSGGEVIPNESEDSPEINEQPASNNYETGELNSPEALQDFEFAQAEVVSEVIETTFESEPEIEGFEEAVSDLEAEELQGLETEEEFASEAEEISIPEIENEPEEQISTDLFDDFRSELGLEEEIEETSVDEGDFETNYQTAIAYKEMGLTEDAIKEFQNAIIQVEADDGTKRFFQCANLLGHCFMVKQMPKLAITWYERALQSENLKNSEILGLYYELANAYESADEFDKSIEYFEKIYAEDVEYRDIPERLKKLRENLVPA